jgi:hypothetical protein
MEIAINDVNNGSDAATKLDLERQRLEGELRLKEAELDLKRNELKARLETERRGFWFSSPLLLAVSTAIFGLIGTGVGAALQGYWNTQLERQKFESTLLQKALETSEKNQAAKNLLFLVNTGLIQQLDANKIQEIAKDPDRLPLSIREGEVTVREAKEILSEHGYYKGDINEVDDAAFREAVKKFQRDKKIRGADGFLGLVTNEELKKLRNE